LDKIYDFNANAGEADKIEFSATMFADYASVQSAMLQSGSDVVITVDAANSITIKNMTLAGLSQSSFSFAS